MVSVAKDCKVHFPPRFKDRKQSVPIAWSDEIKKSIHLNHFRIYQDWERKKVKSVYL